MNDNYIIKIDVFEPDYYNLCKNYMNYYYTANFDVLEPDRINF